MNQFFEELGRSRRLFSPTRQIGRARLNHQICREQTAHLDISQPSSATPTGISPALFSRMVTSSGYLISHIHIERAHTRNLNILSPTRETPPLHIIPPWVPPTPGATELSMEPGNLCPHLRCSSVSLAPSSVSLAPLQFPFLAGFSCSLLTHWRGTVIVTELLTWMEQEACM